MGLLSWLFPSDEDRIASGKAHLEADRWMDARDACEGIDSDAARAVVTSAKQGLARLNIDAALSWGRAGDEERVTAHLELAEELCPNGFEQELRTVRRELREARAAARAEREAERARSEAKELMINPLGVGSEGPGIAGSPGTGLLAPAEEERAARLMLLVENYPESLRGELEQLGAAFGRAVLDLDDGRPDLAMPTLIELGEESALVRYERSRAAYAMNDIPAAVRELHSFARLGGGHHNIGNHHTAVTLAAWSAEMGDLQGGLTVLRALRKTDPSLGAFVYAQLLEATGELNEAEVVLRDLIKKAPRADAYYLALASVRHRGGHDEAAISALEAAMLQVCDSRGCAHKPPNPQVVRTLATLYLETGTDANRGLELADQARGLTEEPTWDDAYLEALAQRSRSDPEWRSIAEMLWERTPAETPQRKRLETNLAL